MIEVEHIPSVASKMNDALLISSTSLCRKRWWSYTFKFASLPRMLFVMIINEMKFRMTRIVVERISIIQNCGRMNCRIRICNWWACLRSVAEQKFMHHQWKQCAHELLSRAIESENVDRIKLILAMMMHFLHGMIVGSCHLDSLLLRVRSLDSKPNSCDQDRKQNNTSNSASNY